MNGNSEKNNKGKQHQDKNGFAYRNPEAASLHDLLLDAQAAFLDGMDTLRLVSLRMESMRQLSPGAAQVSIIIGKNVKVRMEKQ